jgi:hypothetical protein
MAKRLFKTPPPLKLYPGYDAVSTIGYTTYNKVEIWPTSEQARIHSVVACLSESYTIRDSTWCFHNTNKSTQCYRCANLRYPERALISWQVTKTHNYACLQASMTVDLLADTALPTDTPRLSIQINSNNSHCPLCSAVSSPVITHVTVWVPSCPPPLANAPQHHSTTPCSPLPIGHRTASSINPPWHTN